METLKTLILGYLAQYAEGAITAQELHDVIGAAIYEYDFSLTNIEGHQDR